MATTLETLDSLKARHALVVDSKRRLEAVATVEELLRLLEKRDRPQTPRRPPDDEIVVAEIGAQYRALARHLDVPEGRLEHIELRHPTDVPARILDALSAARSLDPDSYRSRLLRALKLCRRNDIAKKIT